MAEPPNFPIPQLSKAAFGDTSKNDLLSLFPLNHDLWWHFRFVTRQLCRQSSHAIYEADTPNNCYRSHVAAASYCAVARQRGGRRGSRLPVNLLAPRGAYCSNCTACCCLPDPNIPPPLAGCQLTSFRTHAMLIPRSSESTCAVSLGARTGAVRLYCCPKRDSVFEKFKRSQSAAQILQSRAGQQSCPALLGRALLSCSVRLNDF